MSKVKSIIILIVTAIFVGFFGFASFVSGPVPNSVKNYKSIFGAISKGIDLAGGYYAVLEPKSDADISDSEMSSIMETIRKRLTDNGFTEASVEKQNSTSIRVEIPEVKNPDDVLKYVGSQGKLEFRDSAGTVWLTGADITKAAAGYDSDGKPAVNLEFTAQGQKKFKNATAAVSASSDKKLYIYLGDEQVSAPTCNEEINSKSAQIQLNGGSAEEAKSLASVITSGSLEVDLKMVESGAMSATLGKNALNNAMIAAGIGMIVIFALLICFYGGMGIAASIALLVYVLLYVGVLAVFPFVQLTFPGIAGIILSIGMAVDANVVIFDRVKEEYAMGKTRKAAISAGYKHAVVTVVDSNVTTLLAAGVLWILTSGSLKGFAITLFLGTLVSMFTAIVITRWFTKVLEGLVREDRRDKFLTLRREAESV